MIKKVLLVVGVLIILGTVGGFFLVRHYYQTGDLQRVVAERVVDQVVGQDRVSSTIGQADLVKKFLGFDGPQTFLVLLLNNTELRPGGGFIGSYAVVQLDKAVPHILKVEGTEILDYSGFPSTTLPQAPTPLTTYLKVPHWYFRDSNWSPDFASSSAVSLNLYRLERGLEAEHITGVIGVTATTLEELLKIAGPVTVGGETFTADNVVEKLEYQVEYAYAKKGIEFHDRKQILGDLVKIVVQKLGTDIFTHWKDYYALALRLLEQKFVVLYDVNPQDQAILRARQWSGEVPHFSGGDYLYWVDANLGALKTDAALKRELSYTLAPSGTSYVATVAMRYTHQGQHDWRTSRYLTYIRLFVPPGSQVIGMTGIQKNAAGVVTALPDQGRELGRTWFGGFATIDPGTVGTVSFTFKLAPALTSAIRQGTYNLLVQKQIGTRGHALTLNLDFGRRVLTAVPAVQGAAQSYQYTGDLSIDRDFEVKLGQ